MKSLQIIFHRLKTKMRGIFHLLANLYLIIGYFILHALQRTAWTHDTKCERGLMKLGEVPKPWSIDVPQINLRSASPSKVLIPWDTSHASMLSPPLCVCYQMPSYKVALWQTPVSGKKLILCYMVWLYMLFGMVRLSMGICYVVCGSPDDNYIMSHDDTISSF